MYPQNFFNLWPAFPRNNKVFVAMSFDERFTKRWETVIQPVIRSVQRGGIALEPQRVDARTISNSILTEILDGISNARLILSDITTLAKFGERPMRNGNVMYELGLAHAVRQPEEVLIFRSDRDELLFDVANIRVNEYQPDETPIEASQKLQTAILESLKEVDLKKNLAVKVAAESLDFDAYLLLMRAHQDDGLMPLEGQTMRQVLLKGSRNIALSRLLEVNALITTVQKGSVTPSMNDVEYEELFRYKPTAFGNALLAYLLEQHKFSPETFGAA